MKDYKSESLDPKEVDSIEKPIISNMYEIEALIEVLARKGIVTNVYQIIYRRH